jgi:hypothetical protein
MRLAKALAQAADASLVLSSDEWLPWESRVWKILSMVIMLMTIVFAVTAT